jgi:NDP-sugar pyrophosphorylase family protein
MAVEGQRRGRARTNESRQIGKTTPLPVHLPRGFYDLISTYSLIGRNCRIGPDAYVGPYTSIGDNTTIRGAEVENTIIVGDCNIDCNRRIVDSLIGRNTQITDSSNSPLRGSRFIIGENTLICV